MQSAQLSSKNQITVPSQVRRQLRIGSGDRIRFEPTKDGRFIVAAASAEVRSSGAARRRLAKGGQSAAPVDIDAVLSARALEEDQRVRKGREKQ